MHPVAITGVGIVSSIGIGAEAVTDSLCRGRSGIKIDPVRQEMGFRSALTGVIENFVPPQLDRKSRKTMTDFALQAWAAVQEAIDMAGWDDALIQSPATGLIIGNDSTALAVSRQVEITRERKSTFPLGASMVFQALNSNVSMTLNTLLGNLGAAWSVSGACASGSHAVAQAAELIAQGRQERVICGGTQEINWESICSFDATNAFSTNHEQPAAASRPFDSTRDGLVPSGGAAIVLLERADLARQRQGEILGYLLSSAFSSDGCSLAVPSGDGLYRCMVDCLNRGATPLDAIDYVCAHATATPVGDAAEAEAIRRVFGDNSPWVSSTKSMTGHEMWMSGAAQVVYTLLMGRRGLIAPNINFHSQESAAAPIRIATEALEIKPRKALLNSAGFGGTNSCILLEIGA